MPGRVVFFIQNASFEPAYQATSMGMSAAAMGDEVYFVLAFDALRQLFRGSFGLPCSERETAEAARAEGLNIPAPLRMLDEARRLGAKLVACDATVRICGFALDEIEGRLDQILALAAIWRLTEGARTFTL